MNAEQLNSYMPGCEEQLQQTQFYHVQNFAWMAAKLSTVIVVR